MVSYRQGKFKPKNPDKYGGDPTNIVFRSSYELKMFEYCDLTESVKSWGSEEKFIVYLDPVSGKYKRYFPDIFMKYIDAEGKLKKLVVEIKPKKDLIEPEKNPKRKTKSWVYQVQMWARNQAKWSAAKEWCKHNDHEFRIFSEYQLGIK